MFWSKNMKNENGLCKENNLMVGFTLITESLIGFNDVFYKHKKYNK